MRKEGDLIEELERLDRFLDGDEEGDIPLQLLHQRGIETPDEATLDDAALHARLWQVIGAIAAMGIFLDSTDHLSDRALYRYLVKDVLIEEAFLPGGPDGVWQVSPIAGGSDEDNAIYLRYYADEETRAEWREDFGESIPDKEPLPFDRDRLLPSAETIHLAGLH